MSLAINPNAAWALQKEMKVKSLCITVQLNSQFSLVSHPHQRHNWVHFLGFFELILLELHDQSAPAHNMLPNDFTRRGFMFVSDRI